MKEDSIDDSKKTIDTITSLIHEYLYKKNYLKTLDTFQEELSEKIRNNTYYNLIEKFHHTPDQSLIKYFENGNKIKFMEQWKRIIPNNLKLMEPTLFKLDFHIEIYFAIYPLLQINCNINDPKIQNILHKNMQEFKQYLDKNTFEQFKSPEFLSYCALPYIQDPRKNSVYAKLFKPEWVNCLKEQLQKCLEYYSPYFSNTYPTLYGNINNEKNINNVPKNNNFNNEQFYQKIDDLKKDNEVLSEENINLRLKEEKNKKNYIESQKTWSNLALDIINHSFELISIYNKITNNEPNDIINLINSKLNKYHDFLTQNLDELNKNQTQVINNENNIIHNINSSREKNDNKNIFSKINIEKPKSQRNYRSIKLLNSDSLLNSYENSFNYNYEVTNIHKNIEKNNYNLINMNKFIEALSHKKYIVDDSKLSYIFRETRLRIFNNKDNPNLQQLTLNSIFSNDLFGVFSNNNPILFSKLIKNNDLNLELMKLVNCLANLYKGRSYLLSNNTIIEDIVNCMKNEKTDTELRQNCLGSIQKFTLRTIAQNKLIELNVINYIINIFSYQSGNLSDYTINYGLALMMNLSLRKKGREKFETVYKKTMKILVDFLSSNNNQILTCVNGILYSLLKKKKFKQEARKLKIEKKLEKITDAQLQKQIYYILQELNETAEDDIIAGAYVNDDENEYIEKDNENEIINNENNNDDFLDENLKQEYYNVLDLFLVDDNENLIEEQKINDYLKNSEMIKIENTDNNLENSNCLASYRDNFNMAEKEEDGSSAFKTKDKILRTPTRNIK